MKNFIDIFWPVIDVKHYAPGAIQTEIEKDIDFLKMNLLLKEYDTCSTNNEYLSIVFQNLNQ